MAISTTRSDLSKVLLVACDQAYDPTVVDGATLLSDFPDSPIPGTPDQYPNSMPQAWGNLSLDQWTARKRYDDPTTGFGATLYERSNGDGSRDYIVAMQGTRGANIQDWGGNLIYGWDKWISPQEEGGQELLTDLLGLASVNKIHFTGQSLGGALAQYAAYDYFDRRVSAAPETREAVRQSMTLTTFNGLGAIEGLSKGLADQSRVFDRDLLANVDTAHFWITNDLVHRLGGGNLNGAGNEYLLDFRKATDQGVQLVRADGSPIAMDFKSAHRIESGFYRGFNLAQGLPANGFPADFADARPRAVAPLAIGGLARAGTYYAWLGNQDGALASDAEAYARFAAALTYGMALGEADEVRALVDAFADNFYAANLVTDFGREQLKLNLPKFLPLLAASPAALSARTAGQLIAFAAETAGQTDKVEVATGFAERFAQLVSGANPAGASPIFDPAQAVGEANAVLAQASGKAKASAYAVVGGGLAVGAALLAVPSIAAAALLTAVSNIFDLTKQLTDDVAAATKAFLREASNALQPTLDSATEVFAETLAQISRAIMSIAIDVSRNATAPAIDAQAFLDNVKASVSAGLEDVAKSIGNAYSDLTLKFTGAFEWGAPVARRTLDALVSALVGEARADTGGTVTYFDTAISSLTLAAQTIVVAEGRGSNPFDDPNFDPDTYALPNAPLAEGSVRTLTTYLPYETGEGGQQIKLQVAGAAADKLSVLSYADEVELDAEGTFTLTVAQGQREVSFGLLAAGDIDADETLTLSATLVDAAGAATHLEHDEATIALDAEAEAPPAPTNQPEGAEGTSANDLMLAAPGGEATGYAGDDEMQGTDGTVLFAGEGDDWLEAGHWDDHAAQYFEISYLGRTIKLGENKLFGGAGNDRIYGDYEAEVDALSGPGTLPTNLPGDWASGGSGDDEVFGSAGEDVLQGGAGADTLMGGAGRDVLLGDDDLHLRAEGNFWTVIHPSFEVADAQFGGFEVGLFPVVNAQQSFPDLVFPYTGDPDFSYYRNGGGDDVLIGGAGKDILIGQLGNDTLYAGDDDDILAGWEGNDILYGGEGDDLMAGEFGRYEQPDQRVIDGVQLVRPGVFNVNGAHDGMVELVGNDYLDGGAGNDTMWGEGGDDVLLGRDGTDTLYGDANYLPAELHGNDLLDAGAGNDQLFGGGGNDRLFGGEGDDFLDGSEGNDSLNGGPGSDTLLGGAGADTLAGGAGNDQLAGHEGADQLQGGQGIDTLDGGEGSDTLYGDEGSDQLEGGLGDDTLYGGAGEDVISGGEGNDAIDGGEGIDIARGGAGDDAYVLDFGYGQDLIEDTQGQNRVQFRSGITSDLLSGQWSGSTLALTFGLSTDTVSFDMSQFQLAGVDFGDGSSWTNKEFVNFAPHVVAQGAPGGGLLQGNAWSRNDLQGAEGNDDVRGASYDDLLASGRGADALDGAGGSDRYVYSADVVGIDRLAESEVSGKAYIDWYYGNLGIADWQFRGEHGGTWQATVEGEGTQIVYFQTYEEAIAQYPDAAIVYVEPLPSIAPLVTRNDTAALEELAQADIVSTDTVEFGEGLGLADLQLTAIVNGSSADAYPEQPWYDGGSLVVRWNGGAAGFSVEVPGVTYGFTGTNLLIDGDPLDDGATGSWRGYRLGAGIETFVFADGSEYKLEEMLQQAALVVRRGYRFERGSGSQDIAASAGSVDFGDAIDAAEVSAQRDGEDLVFQLSDESAEGRIAGWYSDPAAVPEMTFTFADGTVFDTDTVTGLGLTQYGTEGFDFLDADPDFASALYGLGGVDILNGGAGNDLLDPGQGEAGESVLAGQAGDDIYVYDAGYGAVTIDEDAEEGGAGFDTVRFGAGIAPEDVTVDRDYGTLKLTIGAGGDQLPVFGWLYASGGSVERFEFADGTVWDGATVAAMLPGPDTATEGDDALYGTFGDDVIDGLGGNDEIAGFAGDDTLGGGDGDDFVEGRAGIDILRGGDGIDDLEDWQDPSLIDGGAGDDYVYEEGNAVVIGGAGDDWIDNFGDGTVIAYNPSDGNDTVYAAGGFTLSIGGGITTVDLSLDRDGEDLVLSVGVSGSVRLTRAFEADPQAWPEMTLQLFGSVHTYDLTASIDGSIADFHLADSDTDALGGALAWQYATTGSLDALTDGQKRSVLADPGFGNVAQPIALETENQSPLVASPLVDQAADEDAAVGFTVPADTFSDPDAGDALTLSASLTDGSALPGWLSFDVGTGNFSGTPLQADVGALDIRVTATDAGGLSASDDFTLAVANVNDAPVLANPIADQAATEDAPFSFTVPANTVSDEDPGDLIAWFASRSGGSALPAWLSFDAATRTFSGTPTNDDVGAVEIALTATDAGGLSAFDTFAVIVANVNDEPQVANAPGEVFVTAGSPFAFALAADTFADPDAGDTLVYAALSYGGGPLPGWLAFDPATLGFSGAAAAADIGAWPVAVSATDGAGESVSAAFNLAVQSEPGAAVKGGRANDVLYGNSGNETLKGRGGDDALFGFAGNDRLRGGKGNDVLQGGDGNDVLRAGKGQDVLDGGAGDDLIYGGRDGGAIIGGTGNDVIRTGRGTDILVFNRGDGQDTVYSDREGNNTLSLGGGITYEDLRFRKSGKDLVLEIGGSDAITFKHWYSGQGRTSLLNIQIVTEAMAGFDDSAADPMQGARVNVFDAAGLVQAFDAARAADPYLSSWALSAALAQFHLWGNDTAAIGGDLAYHYGLRGSLAGMSLASAQAAIGAPGFGSDAQSLHPFSGLQEGLVKLS